MNGVQETDHEISSGPNSHHADSSANLHLSGSDPRLFPGILTREHRSGSLKNVSHANERISNAHEKDGKTAS